MADTITVRTSSDRDVVEVVTQGPQGPAGEGVPTGGTTGQVLRKASGTDYDTEWAAAASGSGSVTSVSVSGSDGIEVDSGSPITTSGTIALGINAATLRSHINVADGAEVNVNADWNAASGDAQILNKPTLGTAAGVDADQNLGTTDSPSFVQVFTGGNGEGFTIKTSGAEHTNGFALDAETSTIFTTAEAITLAPKLNIEGVLDFTGDNAATNAATTLTNLGAAAASHTHGNLTNDGKIGSTAGLPVVTTTAGAVTTLALGTAGQVLKVNSGATGVEFAADAGGVSAIGASAADILSVSGSDLVADDLGADKLYGWDDSAGKAIGFATVGPTFDGTTLRWPAELVIACSDETTNLTTGTAKVTFRMPYAMTLTAVRSSVNTAPTGSTLIVDINEGGNSILSTKLSIDASEKTSTTAASAAVISDSALADDAEMTIDIDQIGSTVAGKGLKVTLIGTRA